MGQNLHYSIWQVWGGLSLLLLLLLFGSAISTPTNRKLIGVKNRNEMVYKPRCCRRRKLCYYYFAISPIIRPLFASSPSPTYHFFFPTQAYPASLSKITANFVRNVAPISDRLSASIDHESCFIYFLMGDRERDRER